MIPPSEPPPPPLRTRIDPEQTILTWDVEGGSVHHDNQLGGESWEADAFLPPPESAPALPRRGAAGGHGIDLTTAAAMAVIGLCLREGLRSFTSRMVWDEIPGPKPEMKLNGLGDLLGRGAGRRSFRLWPGAGVYACCRENVHIAARKLTADELRSLALRLGFATRGDFEAAIAALPAATHGTPM